jgi:hypothetical protein
MVVVVLAQASAGGNRLATDVAVEATVGVLEYVAVRDGRFGLYARGRHAVSDDPLPDNVAQSFLQLKAAAAQLNTVSDELGKPIAALDQALKRLNLGVGAWVPVWGGDGDHGETYWYVELGYDKIGSTWGIAIRERSGEHGDPEGERCDQWLFPNAPRKWRADAIEKLPMLLETLATTAAETTEKLRARIAKAQEIATSFREPRVTVADQARALAGMTGITGGDAHRAMRDAITKSGKK